MAKISPFKAIRPTRDKVHLVATRPYYTYKKNVLKAKLEDNPFTFLHIINPEFGHIQTSLPNTPERFAIVNEAYHNFMDQGILMQDPLPHIYLYRQTKNGHEYLGVIAGASVDEYLNDEIKKHEATITSREEMFTNYLNIVGYNAEPVLLSYSDPSDEIEVLMQRKVLDRPEYEYTTTDRVKHEMWLLNSDESAEIIAAFEKIPDLYIADGHHRSASSAGLRSFRENEKIPQFPNENFFLSFLLNESKLNIAEFNRFVKTMNGLTKDQLLSKIEKNFIITELTKSTLPQRAHDISMCVKGDWYLLTCKRDIVDSSHPVNGLDAEILTKYILDPILNIKDLKSNDNIEFIAGIEKIKKMEKRILKNEFELGFFLFPVGIEEVKRVADNNMIMPPKSTYVEPKLRSGLTIYNINE